MAPIINPTIPLCLLRVPDTCCAFVALVSTFVPRDWQITSCEGKLVSTDCVGKEAFCEPVAHVQDILKRRARALSSPELRVEVVSMPLVFTTVLEGIDSAMGERHAVCPWWRWRFKHMAMVKLCVHLPTRTHPPRPDLSIFLSPVLFAVLFCMLSSARLLIPAGLNILCGITAAVCLCYTLAEASKPHALRSNWSVPRINLTNITRSTCGCTMHPRPHRPSQPHSLRLHQSTSQPSLP